MSHDLKLLRKYYEGWKLGSFDPELFAEDLVFHSPLAQSINYENFIAIVKEMGTKVPMEDIQFKGLFADGYGNGCAVYDFITTTSVKLRTECAELFQFEDGKIKEIRLIYDPRQWERIIQQESSCL